MNINPLEVFRHLTSLKDKYLARHHNGVKRYAEIIAKSLCPELVDVVIAAASLHDLGKVGIRDKILLKPGKLTDEEWAKMKEHPVVGAELVQKGNGGMGLNGNLAAVVQAVRHHHERWDGTGYPSGIAGEDIPLMARIIAVADAFDAMTTDRPYRKALSVEETVAEIVLYAGKQFDPYIVQVFENTVVHGVKVELSDGSN